MLIEDVIRSENMDFSGIPANYYLLGLLSAFDNRFQAMADQAMGEISWKQFFAVICIRLCRKPPTLRELSDILGSSHQNVKQILLKLERKKFIEFRPDEADRRKQRIVLTEECERFCAKNDEMSVGLMERMFEGISGEALSATIRTIISIEKNMRGIEK